ncbi:YciI family protein [Pedobacter psychroterrae]|uniref:YCII-related domain-containing protein n=1 Tax=Pedobacter psychroterrae TaxID=2530453 RepID=A0A4V2MLE5_9SPHI|nr:YciI family protein [Pedobacter psychroterrae]TCD01607.1 hypothetical protein EZ437_12875 [Pedobacter psychroterrae]
MKTNLIIIASVICCCWIGSATAQTTNKNYDEKLARELKADDYGMKKYILVILKSGSVTDLPKAKLDSVFTGHMANINKLATEGKLIVAGPMGKNDRSYRGIFILDVETVEEAQKLTTTDPAIISQVLAAEYFPWYGSAALKETLKIHSKIEKKSH